jgi:tetratricopeptide (TPR) repeat protein
MSPQAPQENSPLGAYLDTPIKLFILDHTLLVHTVAALGNLGFRQLLPVKVSTNFFQAMKQLYAEITRFEGLVLVNHPPKRVQDHRGVAYQDPAFAEFYRGVASLNKSSQRSASDLLSKCIPTFVSAQDHDIRLRIIADLFPFGIVGVFMLSVLPLGLTKEEQIAEREQELYQYLVEYFQTRDRRLAELKEYKSAEELRRRRQEAERLMAEVEKLKQAGEYDKAIALCRQVTEVLPTDPEAYLEGGRLLVKRRKYPPAMQMFRDAEKVAQDLPTPNQEIGNLRLAQVKDYVANCQRTGMAVDEEKVNAWLAEAVDSFQTAVEKADQIRALDPEQQKQRRTEAHAAIAENILTQDLAEVLGSDNPYVRRLGHLAAEVLQEKVKGEGGLSPRYLVHFGLMAFYDGDLERAEKYLLRAAQHEESFQDACTKLNFIGTQLRRQERFDQAIRIYRRLLELSPPFLGVVLFNLAVALRTKAVVRLGEGTPEAAKLELEALATAVEALYRDPRLPEDENFYQNTVMLPTLKKAQALFAAAARAQASAVQPETDPDDPVAAACRQASRKVEALLKAGKEREALRMLYSLTGSLKQFFLEFDKHASDEVKRFAERLQPLLLKHRDPKMRTFGKVLSILVAKAKQAQARRAASVHPAFRRVLGFLEQGHQAKAAREMARVLATAPSLIKDQAHASDPNLVALCREIRDKLAEVELDKFKRA